MRRFTSTASLVFAAGLSSGAIISQSKAATIMVNSTGTSTIVWNINGILISGLLTKSIGGTTSGSQNWLTTDDMVFSGTAAPVDMTTTGLLILLGYDGIQINSIAFNSTGFVLGSSDGSPLQTAKVTTAAGVTATISAKLDDSAIDFVKSGDGKLVLSSTSNAFKSVTVSAGTLSAGAAAFGSGALTVNDANTGASNTTLDFGVTGTFSNAINVTANGTGVSTISSSVAGSTTLSGAASLAKNTTFAVTDAGGILTASGAVSGAGALTKSGAGQLTLSGSNTYSGGTTFAGGLLSLGSANALGSSGALTFSGGTLQYSASNTTDYSARFSTAAGQGYLIDTNGQNVTFATALTSSGGSLAKSGSGTLTLTAANTYLSTLISGGTLKITDTGAAGLGAVTNNAILELASTALLAIPNTIGGAGAVNATGSGTVVLTGANGYGATNVSAGTLQVGSGGAAGQLGTGTVTVSTGATLAFNRSDSVAVANTITGAGLLAQSGTGTTALTGSNTFSGGVRLDSGTLSLGSSGAIGTAGTIGFSGGTLGFTAANTTDYSARFSTVAGQQYRFDTGTGNVTLAGALTSSGGTLAKFGSGALTLSGTNTFSGTTTVSAGSLFVTGSLASGTTSIASGATLGGTGTLAGITLAPGAKLAPGATGNGVIGTLSAGSLTWNGGATLQFDLTNTSTADKLTLSAALIKGSGTGFVFDFLSATPATGTYTLITAGSNSGFIVSDFSAINLGAGRTANFALSGGNLTLVVSAIPEAPWTVTASLAALLPALFRRRRNKRA